MRLSKETAHLYSDRLYKENQTLKRSRDKYKKIVENVRLYLEEVGYVLDTTIEMNELIRISEGGKYEYKKYPRNN